LAQCQPIADAAILALARSTHPFPATHLFEDQQ